MGENSYISLSQTSVCLIRVVKRQSPGPTAESLSLCRSGVGPRDLHLNTCDALLLPALGILTWVSPLSKKMSVGAMAPSPDPRVEKQ